MLRGAGTDATVYLQLFGDKVVGRPGRGAGLPLAGGLPPHCGAQALTRASMYLPL